ncbi:L-dopachrome tautomerase-related protein [Alienimonas californiensis]|uniref:Major royal jelly protein n=1 Tax=Alienimonas californiensis TaxID=2527989 RepID=A0A517P986_9PLAN|nr:L-dopachrome tautomerase-related protein [Alienimonas californiensis]QDT15946.1 Major royal jelly protein [Alienimonas californiensis]
MLAPLLLAALTASPADLPAERPVGSPELVATFDGPMPTGVSVHPSGRIFVNFPRWGDDPPATLAELKDGTAVPYPSAAMQQFDGMGDSDRLISVQSVVVGPAGRIWALDTGRVEFQPAQPGGPKLIAFDPDSGEAVKKIVFPADVALPTTYLNDMRFDLTRGEAGAAYITDSAPHGGIIVVDLASGDSWRRLHETKPVRPEPNFLPIVEGRPLLQRPEDGQPQPLDTGSDGIALTINRPEGGLSALAPEPMLYFRALAGRRLYSLPTRILDDRNATDEETLRSVTDHGDLGFASDGLESDTEDTLYLTNYEDNAIVARRADGTLETILHDPRLLWPDTLSLGADKFLYVTANQLHRQAKFHGGEDLRETPYALFRVKVNATPVRLKWTPLE